MKMSSLPLVSAVSASVLFPMVIAIAAVMGADLGGWDYVVAGLAGGVGGYVGSSLRLAWEANLEIGRPMAGTPGQWEPERAYE